MRKSFQIAFAGIITALSVALLYLGGAIWILAYVMPMLAGLIMIFTTESFGTKTALLVYACVSVLSVFLIADKECALMYVMYFGYYPILKPLIEKFKSKFLVWLSKLIVFNTAIVFVELLCFFVFHIPFDDFFGKWGMVILLVCANVVFFMYERLFSLVLILYQKKLKNILNKYIK